MWVSRPSLGPAAKAVPVTIRMTTAEVEALDKARGSLSRSTYLRRRLAAAPKIDTKGTP